MEDDHVVKKLLQLSQNFHHLIYIVSMTMTTLLFTKIIKATTTTTTTQRQSHAAIAIAIAIASRRYHFSSSSNNKMGLTKEVLKEGNGQKPTAGQEVSVHCTGYGKNRDLTKVFWSTKDPGQSVFKFKVGLGQVITGWDEGVLDMSIGETSKLTCTPDYAYGAGGFPAWGIMPDSTLVFEIELLSFK